MLLCCRLHLVQPLMCGHSCCQHCRTQLNSSDEVASEARRQTGHMTLVLRCWHSKLECTGTHVPAAFAAITASSSLKHLDLSYSVLQPESDAVQQVDSANPWPFIFPPNKQLLHLTTLDVRFLHPQTAAEDLQACMSCCPELRELHVYQALEPGVLPHALLQLSGLTNVTAPDSHDATLGCWHS